MLSEIYIENLAVIEKATVPFSENLNVFTGETGAGKSILINGINAVLGQRVTRDIVRTGCKKASITGLFTKLGKNVTDKLDEFGISHENDEITVTREIHADGGSVARINSRAVTVSVLREIGEMLIVIYGQHDNQILLSPENHMAVLDSFGDRPELLKEYTESFKSLQSIAKKLGSIKKLQVQKNERMKKLKDITDEIGSLDLAADEYDELENEYNLIQNMESILLALNKSCMILSGEETENVVDMLSECGNELESVSDFSEEILELSERLNSVRIDISDIYGELSRIVDAVDIDQRRAEYVTERYNEINRLKKKYRCEYDELIALYEDSLKELEGMQFSGEEIKRLTEEKNALLLEVTEKAKKLSEYRKLAAESFVQKVTEELSFLDMPNVVFEISHETGKLTIHGMDTMEFLISANKGEPPKPIAKIASGGELSRIMLALKSVIADKDEIPSMIFDEIDTGVSGRAAQKIGIKLRQISKLRQVICVTHLSQLAVMADNHLLIEKNTKGDRTVTSISVLETEGRIREIARIMGGEDPSELMLRNAEEEIKKAQQI